MLLNPRRTVARFLPPNAIATAFIKADGGRLNIPAKILATLWYLLVLPDAQTRLHHQVHRKRVPWYAPSRVVSICVSAANIVTMPLSWGLLIAGKRNAARLASLGVLLNPPSITLSLLLISEISTALLKKSGGIVVGAGSMLAKPFAMIAKISSGSPENAGITESEDPDQPAADATTTDTAAATPTTTATATTAPPTSSATAATPAAAATAAATATEAASAKPDATSTTDKAASKP